ncbi:MAG: universal stress protein [Bacillota bacterium]
MFGTLLVVANGFPAHPRAGRTALRLAAAADAEVVALYVVDRAWAAILGDEWPSSGRARRRFYLYLAAELRARAEAALAAVRAAGEGMGVTVGTRLGTGLPEEIIGAACAQELPDLLVLPYPPAKDPVDALRFSPERILRRVSCRVLFVK